MLSSLHNFSNIIIKNPQYNIYLIKTHNLYLPADDDPRRGHAIDPVLAQSVLTVHYTGCHGGGQRGRYDDSDDVQRAEDYCAYQTLKK